MSRLPKLLKTSRAKLAVLCGLWLAVAAGAQDDAEGPLAKARELAVAGRHAEAIPLYEQLAADVERKEGADAWSLVYLWYELAVQHHSLGDLDQAESLYQRSLTLAEMHRGARDLALVPSLRGLATLAATLERLDEAETFYRRALEIQEEAGDDPTATARTLAELGLLSQLQERPQEAEDFYRRALEIGAELEATDVAVIASNLGALYDHLERYAEAEDFYRRALEIRERLLGSDHPDLARFHDKLGGLRYRDRRFAEAASSYKASLKIREQAGREDLEVAEVLAHLAATYRQLGRSVAAETHFGMAKAILDAQCGGREYVGPCRDALRNHRQLSEQRLAPPAEPVPPPVAVAEAPPSAPPAAPPPSAPPVAPPPSLSAPPPPLPAPPAEPPPLPGPPPLSSPEPPAAADTATGPREPSEAPAAGAAPPPAEARGGRWHRAQVGAREDRREADEILAGLRDSHPQLLGDLPARIFRVDLGERGVWHRVQIGEFAELADAKALCAEIIRRGHEGCWVITTEE